MAKLGIYKNPSKKILNDVRNHPNLVQNLAGGYAYSIDDPATKLITMIGAGFFNEPKYYDQESNIAELSGQAKSVLKTAIAVAKSKNPQDFWVISQWAREELHIRTTPNVLAAIGAYLPETKGWARRYIPRITKRADEPLQVFAAYLALCKGAPLTNSLRRGLADSMAKFSEWQVLRYSSLEGHPNTKDMLLMIDRKEDWPLPKPLFEYIVNGDLIDPEKTPIATASVALAKKGNTFDNEAKELIKQARAPWEVVVSQLGSNKEVWQFLIENNLMGYMAILRNLRNFESIKIDEWARDKVTSKLINGAQNSNQLPFRFLAARKNTSSNWAATAVDLALEESLNNTPELPGRTAILIDSSGSMDCSVSKNSTMSCFDVASSLGSILARKYGTKFVDIYLFADEHKKLKFSDADSIMNLIMMMQEEKRFLGYSTHLHRPLQEMIEEREKYDRIVILSDMQCYGEHFFARYVEPDKLIREYRNKVNHDVFVHSIDLQGFGTCQVDPLDPRVQLLGGWSENVFNLIRTFEGIDSVDAIPSIEELRARYGSH